MIKRFGCVIMASGLGRRFGGNKLLADFRGQPLITRAFAATDGIFDRRVVVTRYPQVALLCHQWDIPCLLHDQPLRSDTVRLGLEAIGDLDGCLFCPGDQPLLRRETVAALEARGRQEPECIWRPVCRETPGAPILFPCWAFPELLALPQGRGGGYVAAKYPQRVRLLPVQDPWELADADTPEALQLLAARGQEKEI
mgnify:FL=1